MKDNKHTDEPKAAVVETPTFMVLDPFTVNLQHEESDQFLQIGITLKVSSMELADKIRQRLPEVRSRLLFLLSSKRASELMPIEGKKKLAQEIIVETNTILGLHTAPQKTLRLKAMPHLTQILYQVWGCHCVRRGSRPSEAAASAPVEATPAAKTVHPIDGVLDVLFTVLIIQ